MIAQIRMDRVILVGCQHRQFLTLDPCDASFAKNMLWHPLFSRTCPWHILVQSVKARTTFLLRPYGEAAREFVATFFPENNVWSIVNTDYAGDLWKYLGAEVDEMTLVVCDHRGRKSHNECEESVVVYVSPITKSRRDGSTSIANSTSWWG
jgi:hypothetical protein